MRVLFDVLGAPSRSGGMRLYADGVIRGWLEMYPDDELVLLGGSWLTEEFGSFQSVTVHHWPNDSAVWRIFGQFVVSAVLYRAARADVVISLSPIVSAFVPRSRRISSVQDWRHIHHPEEFSTLQLIYRGLWKRSTARAFAVVAMSDKTARETANFSPRARCFLVQTGRDYVRYWPEVELNDTADQATFQLLTFGHHTNKRPELVIRSLARLQPAIRTQTRLVVLGANGGYRDSLVELAANEAVGELCDFPGFVDEDTYQELFRGSRTIVMMSSDEGFGLPVADAQYLGIPVVVSVDSGLGDLHEGVIISPLDPVQLAAALTTAFGAGHTKSLRATSRWTDTAEGFRTIAQAAVKGARR